MSIGVQPVPIDDLAIVEPDDNGNLGAASSKKSKKGVKPKTKKKSTMRPVEGEEPLVGEVTESDGEEKQQNRSGMVEDSGMMASDGIDQEPVAGDDGEEPAAALAAVASNSKRRSKAKVKRIRDRDWAAGDTEAEAASESVETDQPAFVAFPVGETVSIRAATVLRNSESLESEEVLQLKKGARCEVLEHGTAEGGRRLRVREEDTGQEGWISCVSSSGRSLLQLVPGLSGPWTSPSPSPSCSHIESAGTQARWAESEAVASSSIVPAELVHQPNPSLNTVAAPIKSSPGRPPLPPVSPTKDGSRSPTASQSPARDDQARVRMIACLFSAIDRNQRERLLCPELRAYANLCGFDDTSEQWEKEYRALCAMYKWDPDVGADLQGFAAMVNDIQGAAYCTDQELLGMLDEVNRFGMPWESGGPGVAEVPGDHGATDFVPSISEHTAMSEKRSSRFSLVSGLKNSFRSHGNSSASSRSSITSRMSVISNSFKAGFKQPFNGSGKRMIPDTE